MAYLRIHCGYCGGTWEVYHNLREFDQAQRCPHCDSKIDGQTWRNAILPAYKDMRAANMALMDDHVVYHYPRFEVDFIADMRFKNAQEGPENADI